MYSKKKVYIYTIITIVLILSVQFFVTGIVLTGDSHQYISMHIHREPLYPVFLLLFRSVFNNIYLTIVGFFQCILLAWSVSSLTTCIYEEFSLKKLGIVIVSFIQLIPIVLTVIVSKTHVFIPGAIMSEALCVPLFYFFLSNIIKLLYKKEMKYLFIAFLLSILLSLTRGQMQVLIIVVGIISTYQIFTVWNKKIFYSILVSLMLVILCFAVRGITVKCYNKIVNGKFIDNTYGKVTFLTNVLYACDRNIGELIEDSLDRDFFYSMFDKAYERGANYSFYKEDSLRNQAYALEKWHDEIKFYCIEDTYYQYFDNNVTTDYIEQNLEADASAMRIIKSVLPSCFGRWIKNYFLLSYIGLTRTILTDNNVLSLIAILEYILSLFIIFMLYKKEIYRKELDLLIISILINFSLCFSSALLIMCLSRYMFYGFALFYMSWMLLLLKIIRHAKEH